KAKQVQSRVKALDRMDMINEVVNDTAAINFKFSFNQPSGRHVITMKDVSKSYGSLEILRNTTGIIERGDKIALIGANGKGKSTLLRIIAGIEKIEGESKIGYNVIAGFFAQHQLESLHVDNEILEELKQAGSGKTEQELRGVLGCFLFSDEDVFKKIKVLSGGEKSRVALAKTLISEANFLLLDEPTNHLDFLSENILIQALQQYQGSFIVVSHNRHFISQVANKIWYIENKEIKEYPGTYDEYNYWRKNIAVSPKEVEPVKKKAEAKPKQQAQPTDESVKKKKALNQKLKEVEDKIESLEKKKGTLETEMAKPEVFGDFEKLNTIQQEFNGIVKQLEEANSNWANLAEDIDALG
ncbi:MAG: ATP-binding cassette domain-containing protein, partial [Cyclobacteriaceae bacterium]